MTKGLERPENKGTEEQVYPPSKKRIPLVSAKLRYGLTREETVETKNRIVHGLLAARLFGDMTDAEARERRKDPVPIGKKGMVDMVLADGTNLTIETIEYGDEEGWPIIEAHGTPGSSLPTSHLRNLDLYRLGLRIIKYSRPGYGDSTPHDGRIVSDCATYVEAIANAYGIEKCSVYGRSGAGPGTIAALAELPGLVVNGAIISGAAPIAGASHWHEDMIKSNIDAYTSDPDTLEAKLERIARQSKEDSMAVINSIIGELGPTDRTFLKQNPFLMQELARSHVIGMRRFGAAGRIADVQAAQKPWGFDFKDLAKVQGKIFLAHGEDDNVHPLQHFQQLKAAIPNSDATAYPGMGHLGTLRLDEEYYIKLKDNAQAVLGANH